MSESGNHLNNPETFPFGYSLDTPRDRLIAALAAGSTESQARAIVDALDAYLETDPADRTPTLQWTPPNHLAELSEAIKQRDEAVARAEKAEQQLANKAKKKRTNGHAIGSAAASGR